MRTSITTEPVILLLADIGGYTRFMLDHRKAQEHGQLIVATLIDAILAQATNPLEVSKLEGDAVFLFARKDAALDPRELADALGERIRVIFGEFEEARSVLARTAICRCGACANVDELRLKVIVHSGEAVVSDFSGLPELSGLDVILAHRLLKNTVPADEYVLLTSPARQDVAFPDDPDLEPRIERYDDMGAVETWVLEGSRVDRECPTCVSGEASDLAYRIIRQEVQGEYREVAVHPHKGFHFHTGRFLAERLEYDDEDIDRMPATALDSFAGTGNPFTLGELPAGARVVDVGCGSGFDALIAAHRVGPDGVVVGVDMTHDMVRKARSAADEAGLTNVTIVEAYAESLPVEDGWADVVISNGAFNLCPDKPEVLQEWNRALRPGGRLQIADILVEKPVPPDAKGDIDLWTG